MKLIASLISCVSCVGATLAVGSVASLNAPAVAWAPEPNPVPTRWEFTFDDGPLRLAWVEVDGRAKPYFYMTYRITNYWGADMLFAPSVDLMTDNGNVVRSGIDVPSAVTDEILRRLDNPLIESQVDIVSTVLEGIEHARDGVVVWPAKDLEADEITVFFAGLSGEYETYIVGRETDNPRRYSLRKTRMLRYSSPGEYAKQGDRPFELIEERWVMR